MDIIGNRTLGDLLEEKAQLRPDHTFLVFESAAGDIQEFTYREFNARVDRLVSALYGLGIRQGDKVTLHLPNSPAFLLTWFALGKLGATSVPSNTANTGGEMLHVVNYSDSVALVTQPDYMPMFRGILPDCPGIKNVILASTNTAVDGDILFDDLLESGSGEPPRPKIHEEDVLQMIFTSGTTSRPKAVMLTHANALRSGERIAKHCAMRPDERCLTPLPIFHVNCQSVSVLSALTVGGTLIMLELYSASKYWQQVRRHKATHISLVPALLRTIAAQPPSADDRDHNLRVVFFAINVTNKEKQDFEQRFGVDLMNGYGLSEAMTVVTVAPLFGLRRWPSIGLPAYDREVMVVDENGREVSRGEIGELIVKGIPGRTLMKGYYKDPEATAEALRDGWLYTGDNASMDELGYLYFFDRKKDVIKRAAENVSASEVERVLVDHPGILEAAVIAVPDPIRDEAVKAFVVLREGVNLTEVQIIDYCAAHLAKFKVPSFIELRSSLPKTSIGKIEKKALRAEEAARRA